MSTGELTVIPGDIYLKKEKLKRRLKRSPTDQELAAELKMSPSLLHSLKTVKVKYNENTLTPRLLHEVRWHIATPNIYLKNSRIDLPAVLNTIAMAVEKEKDATRAGPGTRTGTKRNGRNKIKREKLLDF